MYKYLGGGFIVGIPARDLTDEEARPYLKKSGFLKLYKKVEPAKPKAKEHTTWASERYEKSS